MLRINKIFYPISLGACLVFSQMAAASVLLQCPTQLSGVDDLDEQIAWHWASQQPHGGDWYASSATYWVQNFQGVMGMRGAGTGKPVNPNPELYFSGVQVQETEGLVRVYCIYNITNPQICDANCGKIATTNTSALMISVSNYTTCKIKSYAYGLVACS